VLLCLQSAQCISIRYVGQFLRNIYGQGRGQIWLDDVACTGRETHLFDCRHNGWGIHNCWHGEDVSISCGSSYPGNIRQFCLVIPIQCDTKFNPRWFDSQVRSGLRSGNFSGYLWFMLLDIRRQCKISVGDGTLYGITLSSFWIIYGAQNYAQKFSAVGEILENTRG